MSFGDEEDPPPNERRPSLSGVRILVLDDNKSSAASLGRAIEHLGGVAFVSHAIAEAKRLLVVMEPDAAIVDFLLLNGNGLGVIRDFQEHRPSLACVLVSGMDVPPGFEGVPFLPKPIQLAELARVVLDAIGRMDTEPPKTEPNP